ncbi:MAG TPA: exodeoxyribonuclease V subunit gamma [Propionibacteriaceae bacterium]|nr:exodeoxyribonuclease V subunit gamma [Propionibacteriaceae bacterium]
MNRSPSPGLVVHLGERLDVLADALGDLLEGPRDDPFSMDLVTVPGPGMQRWLAQRLSRRLGAVQDDGVCAGVAFTSIDRLCRDVMATATGVDPRDDPWAGERLTWAVLRAFHASAGEPWFAPVESHLAGGDHERPGRRYATAQRLARLFNRWLRWRPADLESWLTDTDHWQARLWRSVVDQIDALDPFESRRAALRAVVDRPDDVALPPMLHVLCPGPVSPLVREVVSALAQHREVQVWLVAPDAAPSDDQPTRSSGPVRSREAAVWRSAATAVRIHQVGQGPLTLLGALQGEVRGAPLGTWPTDTTVQVHSSHGPERQVEVLRDILVGLLESDPSLEPRDIVVMTPDLATYGPLLRARTGLKLGEAQGLLHPAHGIRIAVADRSLREANPVLDVLSRVLDLITSRAEVSELLDLCATAPVSRRFHFGGEVERLGQLMRGAGIRWGIDAKSRARFGVSHFQNTWQMGLNRLLLGVTLSERDLVAVNQTAPYDLIDSQEVALVGSLAELAGRLRAAMDVCATPAAPVVWAARLRSILIGDHDEAGDLVGGLVSVSASDGWQVSQAQAQLADLAEAAGGEAPLLSLGDIKVLVRERLQGHMARSALLTGNLTVTSLDALSQVPHRVVVLLGLDEQQFPRAVVADGDDVLGRSPDEPDAAQLDRQAFTDAMMSALETFVVIHRGRDTRSNEPVPTPIPVQELVDAAARHGVEVVTQHRLQPYDLEGFSVGAPASYDAAAAAGARALAVGRSTGAPRARDRYSTEGISPTAAPESLDLDDVIAFLQDPLRFFKQNRLLLKNRWQDSSTDQIPLELKALEASAIQRRMLSLRLSGVESGALQLNERLRGSVPPMALGDRWLADATRSVEQVVRKAAPLLAVAPRDLDIALELPCGILLTGRVSVRDTLVLTVMTGWLKGKWVVDLWVKLLAAAASEPDPQRWRGRLISDREVQLAAPTDPVPVLDDLVRLYLSGRDRPLLLPSDIAWSAITDQLDNKPTLPSPRRSWRYERDSWRGYAPDDFDEFLAAPGPDGKPEFLTLLPRVYGPIAAARPTHQGAQR